jgi:hypothetical protein
VCLIVCLSLDRPANDLASFVEHFGHWVSINHSSSLQRSNTLLFNTACLLASRYMPGLPQHTVRDISLYVQHAVAKVLWKPPPMTSDMLQALTLLCLYSTSIHKEGLMDDWLLSGISINHALISFNFLNTLPGDNLSPDELLAQLRLWNTLCATQLQYVLPNNSSGIQSNTNPTAPPSQTAALSTSNNNTSTNVPAS